MIGMSLLEHSATHMALKSGTLYHKHVPQGKHMFDEVLTPLEMGMLKSSGRTGVWPKISGD